MEPKIRLLSLGAGVQSTTLALMCAHGEFEDIPSAAIFADTGWEPRRVYEHLEWLRSGNVLPFPVSVVSRGNLREDLLSRSAPGGESEQRFASVPFFTSGGGMGRRQCTKDYKIYPIRNEAKRLLGWPDGKRIPEGAIEQWIGISTDEATRMKPSAVKYAVNRFPLIEKRMSRWDCYNWLERHDYPVVRPKDATLETPSWPPKSSCNGCPFHNDAHWREMRDHTPDEWGDTVSVDHAMRDGGTMRGMTEAQYMHRSLVPLDEVDLSTDEDRGQINLFENECEGMCGV